MQINFKEIEDKFRVSDDQKCSTANNGMIATQSAYATEIGKKMLLKNGNAVDAAVAAVTQLSSQSQAGGGSAAAAHY